MNFIYNGIEYKEGTKVKILTSRYGEQIMVYSDSPWLSEFKSDKPTVPNIKVSTPNVEYLKITEIVEPVYARNTIIDTTTSDKYRPAPWDVEIGWIWYIIIMVVGTIFNCRWLIWIFATVIFFGWKYGFLGGKE